MARRTDQAEEVTYAEAGRRLGMTPNAIGLYAAREGAPVAMHGPRRTCLWPQFPVWWRRQIIESKEKPLNIAESEARIAAADAELKELKLQRERGEVLPMSLFHETIATIAATIRAQLLAVPGRYAPRTASMASLVESQAAWDSAVRDVLNDLRDGNGNGSRR